VTQDTCNAAVNPTTGCVHTPITCGNTDNNICTTESCEPLRGCVSSNNTAPCNDNNICTVDVGPNPLSYHMFTLWEQLAVCPVPYR
jgi:hypothetical protein